MPRSMTGFARSEQQYDWGSLTWELRSVNHRYLEMHFRLPDSHKAIEPGLRELIRAKLSRGKLEVNLAINLRSQNSEGLGINLQLAEEILQAAKKIQGLSHQSADINPLEVLRWPGVIAEQKFAMEQVHDSAMQQFQDTIDQLSASRQREGDELANFIEQRLQNISEQVILVRGLMPKILTAQKDKLHERLANLDIELDPERLEQEVVLLAQKADVDEELDRLDVHVNEVRRNLSDKKPIGRRLDFLMQELNRAANTLSSKSIVTDTTQSAVELKVLIEQMREQIQNIE
jgi:uncharacterized protein (TIGR00255 family)